MKNLLSLTVSKLLQRFAAGEAVPGAGSAAALNGLLAASLIITVCTLTGNKEKYAQSHSRCKAARRRANTIRAQLELLFQADNDKFAEVIRARQARDSETCPDVKRCFDQDGLDRLTEATQLALETSELCSQLLHIAAQLRSHTYKSASADLETAMWSALAGAQAARAAVSLNLNRLKNRRGLEGEHHRHRKITAELETSYLRILSAEAQAGIASIHNRLLGYGRRLRPIARKRFREEARALAEQLADRMEPSGFELFWEDLESRVRIEERLLHNRLAPNQILQFCNDALSAHSCFNEHNHG